MRIDESLLNRRDFLDGLIGAGIVAGGAVAGETVLGYLTGLEEPEPDQITVKDKKALDTLKNDRFVLVRYGPRPVMVFRLPDDELRALSAVCTHGACNVRYRPRENDIYCGCHKGRFTAEGVNVPGTPPPRPLREFHVRRQQDGTLLVSNQPFGSATQPGDLDGPAMPVEG